VDKWDLLTLHSAEQLLALDMTPFSVFPAISDGGFMHAGRGIDKYLTNQI